MYTSWDIRYSITTSGCRPPSLNSHSPSSRTVLTFAPHCCSTPKNRRIPLKFHIYSFCNFNYKHSLLYVRHFDYPVECGSNYALGNVATSSGDFSILKSKYGSVEFAPVGDLRPLIQWFSQITHRSSALGEYHELVYTRFGRLCEHKSTRRVPLTRRPRRFLLQLQLPNC